MVKVAGMNEDNAWESGGLGTEAAFVSKSEEDSGVDDKLGLQMVSIRLQKSLIEDLKELSELNGIGYQPLMRQVLKRFVDAQRNIYCSRL